jgi:hypothetical protein
LGKTAGHPRAGGTSPGGVQALRRGAAAEVSGQVVVLAGPEEGVAAGLGREATSVAAAPAKDVWQDSALLALLRGRGYPLGAAARRGTGCSTEHAVMSGGVRIW